MHKLKTSAFVVMMAFVSVGIGPVQAQKESSVEDAKVADYMARRVKSAEQIIADANTYQQHAAQCQKDVTLLLAQSTKLKGEANYLHSAMPQIPAKIQMTPAQLKAAEDDYKAHIAQFKSHALEYQNHLEIFKKTIGECHANDAEFQQLASSIQLHVDQFHMHMPTPTIRPPHICGVMAGAGVNAAAAQASIRANMMRVAKSEQALAVEENQLQAENSLSGTLDNKVAHAAIRANQEKEIYGEFSRLKSEYDLLKTEKDILAVSGKGGTKITTTAVNAQIRH